MHRLLKLTLAAVLVCGTLLTTGMTGAGANESGVVVFPAASATTSPLTFPTPALTGSGTWSLVANEGDCTGVPQAACGGIDVSGTLGPVGGVIGPFCGASSGQGSGHALGHDNVNVSWASTVGSVFPVTVTGTGHTATVVLVQVSPKDPAACAGSGATEFNVRIVAAVV